MRYVFAGLIIIGSGTCAVTSSAAVPTFRNVVGEDASGDQVTAEFLAADRGIIDSRRRFGLPIDHDSLMLAATETLRREEAAPMLDTVLSNEELEALDEFNLFAEESKALVDYVFSHPSAFGGIEWSRSILDPSGQIIVTPAATPADVAGLERVTPSIGRVATRDGAASIDDKFGLHQDLTNYARGGAATSELTRDLEAYGLRPHTVLLTAGAVTIEAVFDDTLPELDKQAIWTAVARDIVRNNRDTELQVSFGPVAEEAADRLDSPGQAKGGLRIWSIYNACTTGFSARIGSEVYVMTAGHCRQGNNAVFHPDNSSDRINFGTIPSTLAVNVNGFMLWGIPALYGQDYALIDSPDSRPGLGSHYIMTVPSWTPAGQYVSVTGLNSSSEWLSPTYVCYDGASPYHAEIYSWNLMRTACGWVSALDSNAYVWAAVPVCAGDSGAPVRVGGVAYGLVKGHAYDISESCGSTMIYGRLAPALASAGASLVTQGSPTRNWTRNNLGTGGQGLGFCISAKDSGIVNGTKYWQWSCLDSNPDAQAFYLEPVPASWGLDADKYHLVRYLGSTRYCLSVNNDTAGGTGNGAKLHSWVCQSSYNGAQVWDVDFSGTADYLVLSPTQAPSKVISVDSSLAQNGVDLHLWGHSGGFVTAQRWKLQ